ncbi:MAG: phospholipase C [Acidimicrobiales bacterium]
MDKHSVFEHALSRRNLLKAAGLAGLGTIAAPVIESAAAAASRPRRAREIPIQHIVIDCQENHSFDNYYGFAPWIGKYGVPQGYSQPNGSGGTTTPYHLTTLSPPDPNEGWGAYHDEWDQGKMDGFFTAGGAAAMGYFTEVDLPFYYSLHERFTLCVNYFCSAMTETYPNRFYLAAGTSGGITDNGVYGFGVLDYPCILDLLDAAGISWKVYNLGGFDDVPAGDSDNIFVFFKNFANDPRTRATDQDFLDDTSNGSLPNVSYMIPSYTHQLDEHPPADVLAGMGLQETMITALMESPLWERSAYIVTYDEHGGYFDHVPPPQLDAYGLGMRVPTWVISPHAKRGHLEPTLYEHGSTLKFIEAVFGLPTLASVNHQFDQNTPGGPNNQAATGAALGPPAPPRDGRSDIGNLLECFDFGNHRRGDKASSRATR